MEMDHHWSVKPGAYGRGLRKFVKPETWSELESTYVGPGETENWDALFRTIELFRTSAVGVGNHLGFSYPDEVHQRVVQYLRKVKDLDRQAEAFS